MTRNVEELKFWLSIGELQKRYLFWMVWIKYGEFFSITSDKLEINLVKYKTWKKEKIKEKVNNEAPLRRIFTHHDVSGSDQKWDEESQNDEKQKDHFKNKK